MTPWTDLLEEVEFIDELYLKAPELSDFLLAELVVLSDEDACLLRGTFSRFADAPRSDWESDANCVGVRLRLQGLESIEIKGWTSKNVVDLQMNYDPKAQLITLVGSGEGVDFRLVGSTLHLDEVFAYCSLRP